MKRLVLVIFIFAVCILDGPAVESSKEKSSIGGCRVFPANNIWNTPIDTLPKDANSNLYINTIGADKNVHADFGSGLWDGGPIGIPFTTVPGTQEKVAVTFDYDDESDPGPYPIPPDAPIEGGSESDGDRHVLVLDRDNCILYELYYAFPQADGSWTAGSGAVFNLNSNDLRPAGWTSADAAGLPILPGLVRYEEVAAGEITHAIRFTAPQTRKKYIWPARHYASSLTGSQYPPMGQRFRLKAGFDISGFSTHARVILTALKKYGMILADNGSSWFISGVPDERWDNGVLQELHNVKGSDFEAVDESSLMVSPNSGQAQQSVSTPEITVTSPKGGESWAAGSTQAITWTTSGSVGNVKIQLLKGGSSVLTVSSSTSNDGTESWTLPGSLSAGSDYQIKITDTSNGSITDSGDFFTITVTTPAQAEISLNRTQLNFKAVISGVSTGAQTFLVSNSGTGTLSWAIDHEADWLSAGPFSGTGSGIVAVTVNPTGLSTGTYTGSITVSASNAVNSPQTVTVYLTVKNAAQDQPPFGSFDTPVDNSTVRSSIPVTGWALDDIEVESVKIYRRQGDRSVYIGDAVFVEGARPDVEAAYPGYPNHYKAGWGYMMLTNFLPDGGNGTFTFHAAARDVTGNEVILGSKTVTCDNADAVKPFGAIDTPGQGGDASGSDFINWGWALTPMPNMIPTDGSTIDVYVDGVNLGHPVYNIYRSDIAGLFPGYANSGGAVGYFYLDTTQYADGVHTIQWTAADNAGNTDGIGSRYFTVKNSGGDQRTRERNAARLFRESIPEIPVDYPGTLRIKRGYHPDTEPVEMYPDEKGRVHIKIRELERLEIHFPGRDQRLLCPLPTGSFLDPERGIFYWQPGPGFMGSYEFVFIEKTASGEPARRSIRIKIVPY